MSVAAVSMVKDEHDIIEHTVRNMAAQVDVVIVADNGSTDGTREILDRLAVELPGLMILDDPEPAYLQSVKMTALARTAGEMGATWIVPFDADEVWYSGFGAVCEVLEDLPAGIAVAKAELFDHVATGVDPADELDPTRRMGWRRRCPLPLPKVACRWRPDLVIHQGNHGCDYGGIVPAGDVNLVVRHFPYRSVAQLVSKVRNGAAAYHAAGDRVPAGAGQHWREWGEHLDDDQWFIDLFNVWYRAEDPFSQDANLLYDPAPVWRTLSP